MRPVLLLGFPEEEIPNQLLARVRTASAGREVVVSAERSSIEGLLDRLEIAVGSVPFELFSRAPGLRWYHHWYAGVDWLERYPHIRSSSLQITNTSGLHAVCASEHVLGIMFAFARNLHLNIQAQERHEWRRESMSDVFELSGKRILVVGTGAIGAHLGRAAVCLGMDVAGIRRHPEIRAEGIASVFGIADLHRQLGLADFVVVTLPSTPDTRTMFSVKEFGAMRSDAWFINIGRGSLVDQAALVEALQSGKIRGAGLDVFETEPLPAESPLWSMTNVIITPHTAGYTPEYMRRSLEIFLDNLPRYFAGEPLHHSVDKESGY